jgi:calcium-translocating P-type ATPase
VIPATELVIGDVVLLEAGDRISADLTVLRATALAVDESMLTGESAAVHPAVGDAVRAGTFVVEGEADALVSAIGSATRLAGIAALTQRVRDAPGPLAVQLNRMVRIIAFIALGIGVVFFAVGVALGMSVSAGFLFAVGVTVALVPEGLLPTVTLSLALAAQRMARQSALVRRLDAVETLGLTTFICSDKTGTLTRNEMAAVAVWTPAGEAWLCSSGYEPEPVVVDPALVTQVRRVAESAVRASTGRISPAAQGGHRPVGDPMEAALHVLALRCGVDVRQAEHRDPELARLPFDPRRRRVTVLAGGSLHVKGSPEAVIPLCHPEPEALRAAEALTAQGLRVLAVARRSVPVAERDRPLAELERTGLQMLGLVALEDPPRDDVGEAIASCRNAGIRLAMITGDHPATAEAIARQTGLHRPEAPVITGQDLPADVERLGALLDVDGIVVARVAPEQKLLIAQALRRRGHIVAMTGDGVNDAPALREADVGVAMGSSGTDTAREAADLVLLDDHFGTIVTAISLGRATYRNVRRFLTYHLTDNVAELAPFVAWAVTGGSFPLAIGVLQVLALDIGTDLLPALALGAEPAHPRVLEGGQSRKKLAGRDVLTRAFAILGPVEAAFALAAFTTILVTSGWRWGANPSPSVLAAASGTAFTAIVLGQLANAVACRSEDRPFYRLPVGNRLLLVAIAAELAALLVFLALPPLPTLLGGSFPSALGWALAALTVPAVLAADTMHKAFRARRRHAQQPPSAVG